MTTSASVMLLYNTARDRLIMVAAGVQFDGYRRK